MKIKYIALLLVFMSVFMVGCSFQRGPKLQEKAIENLAEGLINKALNEAIKDDDSDDGSDSDDKNSDAKVNLNIGEGTLTIDDGDDTSFSFGMGEWPDNELGRLIPRFDKGNIISLISSDDTVMITFEGVNVDDYKSYEAALKKDGYDKNVSTMMTEDIVSYSASSADEEVYVSVLFMPESENMTISVSVYR